jgi:hypothetical protein
MVKILRALLAHWANLDNLPLETAETSLCLHLNVRRLEDCTLTDTDRAFSFLLRAQHLPVNTGEKAAEEQLDCIRLIADGCTQFRACRDGDLYGLLKRVYGLTPEDFDGIEIKPHGNGLVVKDRHGKHAVKASAVDSSLSLKKLEARFGPPISRPQG